MVTVASWRERVAARRRAAAGVAAAVAAPARAARDLGERVVELEHVELVRHTTTVTSERLSTPHPFTSRILPRRRTRTHVALARYTTTVTSERSPGPRPYAPRPLSSAHLVPVADRYMTVI